MFDSPLVSAAVVVVPSSLTFGREAVLRRLSDSTSCTSSTIAASCARSSAWSRERLDLPLKGIPEFLVFSLGVLGFGGNKVGVRTVQIRPPTGFRPKIG